MNTMIYKRTHKGDPNESGIFGIYDCMGQVRSRNFDAVIGIGGKRPWRNHEDIAFKVNWIGINPHKSESINLKRGPLVEFDSFLLLDENGPYLKKLAPKLFKYLFGNDHVRVVMSKSLPDSIQKEITKILELAENKRSAKSLTLREKISTNNRC